ATIANMAPEYGATCGMFPVDAETLRYLRFSGRPAEQVALCEAYAREQGLFGGGDQTVEYTDTMELDLGSVEPSLAGPKRPQDRVRLSSARQSFEQALPSLVKPKKKAPGDGAGAAAGAGTGAASADVKNGSVVIAAITSCTNTSNPSVMLAAGLLAK